MPVLFHIEELIYCYTMRILITGGAGFIGSHLAEVLEEAGDEVTILDSLSSVGNINLKAINFAGNFVEGDIRNRVLVKSLIKEVDLVYHLAASLGVSRIMNDTLEAISVNVNGSEVVLTEAAKEKKRIFIASTSEIYGKNPKQPLSETDDRIIGTPQNIRWSYSDSKAIEESIARSLFLTENLNVITIRFFNTVGPRQTGKYGMVLPRFIHSALKNEPLEIHGDGQQTRVFCHVSDAVQALFQLSNLDQAIGEVFNVGGIGEITIETLADKVISKSNSKSIKRFVPYKEAYPEGFEDMPRRVPNIEKIQKYCGWSPQYGIESIIRDTIDSIANKK
jgi:UDP-glucose 4-epimerase